MWVCLNNAFVSIVSPRPDSPLLLCRARQSGDLERAFPGCVVKRTPGRDYLFRTELPRVVVSDRIALLALSIDYPNFKNSVRDDKLHKAYSRVWSVMAGLQPVQPYATEPQPNARAIKGAAPARRLFGTP